jgi:hypothetical protein
MTKLPEWMNDLLRVRLDGPETATGRIPLSDKAQIFSAAEIYLEDAQVIADALIVADPDAPSIANRVKATLVGLIGLGIISSDVNHMFRIHQIRMAVDRFDARQRAGSRAGHEDEGSTS